MKKNISALPSQYEKLKLLNPVSYQWIDTEEMGSQTEIGLIAQEVQQLVPEVIGTIVMVCCLLIIQN